MNNKQPKSNTRFFKTDPRPLGQFAEGDIDAESGIIRNVVMCQEGEAKGHGVHLEGEFIEALAKYDRKYHKKSGLKARFDHPGMCSGTQGTQLGYFSNFQVREIDGKDDEGNDVKLKQLVADLEVLNSAELSPTQPGMKTWMMSMAEEAPDFIMSSIVFQFSRYYQRTEKGRKEYRSEVDMFGNLIFDETRRLFIEFGKNGRHHYTDIVEAGAATDNLFSAKFNSKQFGVQVSEFLREQPELLEFVKNNPDKVQQYLNNAGIQFNISKQNTAMGKIKDWFFKSDESDNSLEGLPEEVKQEMQDSRAAFKQLQEENAQLKLAAKAKPTTEAPATEENNENTEDKALSQELADLKADFAAFKNAAAANHTETPSDEEAPEETKVRAYHKTSINRKTVYRDEAK